MKKVVRKLALVAALVLPLLVMAQDATENNSERRPFWGTGLANCSGSIIYPDSHCEKTCEVHQYYFWIDFGQVDTVTVPC